jgi:hypothetical protein
MKMLLRVESQLDISWRRQTWQCHPQISTSIFAECGSVALGHSALALGSELPCWLQAVDVTDLHHHLPRLRGVSLEGLEELSSLAFSRAATIARDN